MAKSNPSTKVAYHHGDLRAALVEAALDELHRGGKLPSWRALARACGVSQSAPYRHFDSLEALEAAVAVACFERLGNAVIAAVSDLSPGTEPEVFLAEGLRAYVRFGTAHPAWYGLMFGSGFSFEAHPEAREAAKLAYTTLEAGVSFMGVTEVPAVAYAAWAALHGLVDLFSRVRLRPPLEDDGLLAEQVVAMIVAHVQAHVPPKATCEA